MNNNLGNFFLVVYWEELNLIDWNQNKIHNKQLFESSLDYFWELTKSIVPKSSNIIIYKKRETKYKFPLIWKEKYLNMQREIAVREEWLMSRISWIWTICLFCVNKLIETWNYCQTQTNENVSNHWIELKRIEELLCWFEVDKHSHFLSVTHLNMFELKDNR